MLDKSCNIQDPESVRSWIASRHVTSGRKQNIVDVYSRYAIFSKIAWSRPEYAREDRLPFIPLQKECEQIVDASRNLGQACYLRLLYETAMRCGEASSLRREDFDFERRTVRVLPEKKSRPRELRISERLCQNNPRFHQIHLHTFRHLRATSLYAQTKDLLYVQKILGHKSIQNTMRYIQLVSNDEPSAWIVKAASSLDEAKGLLEQGFEYVTDMESVKLFRRRA